MLIEEERDAVANDHRSTSFDLGTEFQWTMDADDRACFSLQY